MMISEILKNKGRYRHQDFSVLRARLSLSTGSWSLEARRSPIYFTVSPVLDVNLSKFIESQVVESDTFIRAIKHQVRLYGKRIISIDIILLQ